MAGREWHTDSVVADGWGDGHSTTPITRVTDAADDRTTGIEPHRHRGVVAVSVYLQHVSSRYHERYRTWSPIILADPPKIILPDYPDAECTQNCGAHPPPRVRTTFCHKRHLGLSHPNWLKKTTPLLIGGWKWDEWVLQVRINAFGEPQTVW